MKRFRDGVRVAPGTTYTRKRHRYDRDAFRWVEDGTEERPFGEADEIGLHAGTVYASRALGDRNILRVARDAHNCHGEGTIQPGDVYVECLSNGTRNTGIRSCIPCAVERGEAMVNPPLVRWDRESREWVAFDPTKEVLR